MGALIWVTHVNSVSNQFYQRLVCCLKSGTSVQLAGVSPGHSAKGETAGG